MNFTKIVGRKANNKLQSETVQILVTICFANNATLTRFLYQHVYTNMNLILLTTVIVTVKKHFLNIVYS